ncbi:hypothetical protein OUZ56_021965 [Daphnia magna]|uniref:Uncharacterized protein n=1 Tax=Daphnia magna TaxID=35525 RepID=A0ABR0AUY3_9CRUS|nr:hypothetical protein OUZ56_021965 [Daphnia magna]
MTWLKIYVVDAIQWFPARPSRPSTSSETLLLPSLCAGCQQNIKRSRDVESNEITHLLLSDRALSSSAKKDPVDDCVRLGRLLILLLLTLFLRCRFDVELNARGRHSHNFLSNFKATNTAYNQDREVNSKGFTATD